MNVSMTTPRALRLAILLVLAAPLGATACASAGGARASSTSDQRRANLLTQEEIEKSQLNNLYDVVRSLRPRWMQTRGMDSLRQPTQIQVYVGGQHLSGGLDQLRELSALGVAKVEFLDPAKAMARYGTGHGEGAILVTLSSR